MVWFYRRRLSDLAAQEAEHATERGDRAAWAKPSVGTGEGTGGVLEAGQHVQMTTWRSR